VARAAALMDYDFMEKTLKKEKEEEEKTQQGFANGLKGLFKKPDTPLSIEKKRTVKQRFEDKIESISKTARNAQVLKEVRAQIESEVKAKDKFSMSNNPDI
jgi:tRNA C32,U32 (ribose-2'-O)-methylase TrmJ